MTQTASIDLIVNGTVQPNQYWGGGRGLFQVAGTFGGAGVTLEYQMRNGAWMAVQVMATDGTRTTINTTANGAFVFELPSCPIRATVTGGTPSGLYAAADRIIY